MWNTRVCLQEHLPCLLCRSIGKIDRLLDDIQEQQDLQQEVTQVLAQGLPPLDDVSLDVVIWPGGLIFYSVSSLPRSGQLLVPDTCMPLLKLAIWAADWPVLIHSKQRTLYPEQMREATESNRRSVGAAREL